MGLTVNLEGLVQQEHVLYKRETPGGEKAGSVAASADGKTGFQKFEEKIGITDLASKTGVSHWAVFGTFLLIILIIVGLIGWCAFRFLRKKRPGKKIILMVSITFSRFHKSLQFRIEITFNVIRKKYIRLYE